ncbi:hypothetical protein [Leuconostoc falkenbergense]|uniref:hypothetical protein n=1 Tax=Leuconostoc falkenbergense TaxID=2766470 RepID=UPI003BAF8147
MKKIKDWNKKQKITGVVVLSVLVLGAGGTALAVHNNNVAQAQEVANQKAQDKKVADAKTKALKAEKEREASAEIVLSEALAKAVKEPSTDNIKAVQTAMKNVKSETVVKQATTSLKAVQTRLELINRAKKAVADYQADAMNDTKKAEAQQALSKLTNASDKATLTVLQSKVTESTKQADNAKAVATANAKAQAKANEQAKASAKQASGSTSNNSTSNGWINSNGSNSSGYSNSGNYAKSGASQSGSSSNTGSFSTKNNNSSTFVGGETNTKKDSQALNQGERDASNQTQAPSWWN